MAPEPSRAQRGRLDSAAMDAQARIARSPTPGTVRGPSRSALHARRTTRCDRNGSGARQSSTRSRSHAPPGAAAPGPRA